MLFIWCTGQIGKRFSRGSIFLSALMHRATWKYVFPSWRKKLWWWPLTPQMSCCCVMQVCTSKASTHLSMNASGQSLRVFFQWTYLFNSYSVKQEGSCHFLTLYAFVIFTCLNGPCVLMLLNECISLGKWWDATPSYHGRSGIPRSGNMSLFLQRKTF